MNTILRTVLASVLLTLGSGAYGQTWEKTIRLYETPITTDEELLNGLADAINSSDRLKYISYFPLQYDSKHNRFQSMTMFTSSFYPPTNLWYSSLFGSEPYHLFFGEYLTGYIGVKMLLLKAYSSIDSRVITIASIDEASKIEKQIDAAGSHKIKFRIKDTKPDPDPDPDADSGSDPVPTSEYGGKNRRYVFFDILGTDNTVLETDNVVLVEELDHQQRVTMMMLGVH
jgi:hypothetical protein